MATSFAHERELCSPLGASHLKGSAPPEASLLLLFSFLDDFDNFVDFVDFGVFFDFDNFEDFANFVDFFYFVDFADFADFRRFWMISDDFG